MKEKPALEQSMRVHGFMPSSPLHCTRAANGKFKVIRGHHRLEYAKRLGLGVWYVVDKTVTDIFELEGSPSTWSLKDFVEGRARAGDEDCKRVLSFQERYGIGLGVAVSLMSGESAGSSNAGGRVRRGTFRVTRNLAHAQLVGELVDFCHASGSSCARESGFVNALSSVARIPEFDPQVFKQRVSKMPSLISKQATGKSYLTIIEDVYNYGAKGKRIPLAFRAVEVARQRKLSFGGKNGRGARPSDTKRSAAIKVASPAVQQTIQP